MSQIALVSRSGSRISSDDMDMEYFKGSDTDSDLGIDNVCFTLGPDETENSIDAAVHEAVTLPEEETSYWGSLCLAYIMVFFMSVGFTMFLPTLWPYLNTIDPSMEESFLGYVVAMYSVGQAVAAPTLGYWSHRIKRTKPPIAVGFTMMLVANIIYFFAPAFPQVSRKWILMLSRFLSGAGSGVNATLRGYVAAASTVKDRVRAMSLVSGAFSLGMTFGPAFQAAFTPIGYPGLDFGVFDLNMYTAAAFFSLVINIILLVLVTVYSGLKSVSHLQMKPRKAFYALPKFDKVAAIICIFTWFVYMTAFTMVETIQTPYTMAMYDWSDERASEYNSIILSCQGIVSLITVLLYAWKVGQILDPRFAAVTGLSLITLFHIITYPFPFYTDSLSFQLTVLQNATQNHSLVNDQFMAAGSGENPYVGCATYMTWCQSTPRVPKWIFIPALVFLCGLGFQFISAPVSTLFSKILGNRRQTTMYGFLLQSGSCARIIGPIFVMQMFTYLGPKVTWLVTGGTMIAGLLPWLIFWKRMVPLKTEMQMKAGDSFTYKKGTFYKF